MYICICNGITDNEIRNAIDSYCYELKINHNDRLSNNSDSVDIATSIINCNNGAVRNIIPACYATSLEQTEANLDSPRSCCNAAKFVPMHTKSLSKLDYIKEKLDFDFCCGKCQCMINDIIHHYNKIDL